MNLIVNVAFNNLTLSDSKSQIALITVGQIVVVRVRWPHLASPTAITRPYYLA